MKKIVFSLIGIITILFLTGCGQNSIDGEYNAVSSQFGDSGDGPGLVELSIKDEKVTMAVSVYEADSSGFMGMNMDIKPQQIELSGTVDPSKKTITIEIDGQKMNMAYKKEKEKLTFTEDGKKVDFYEKESTEYKNNQIEFEKLGEKLEEDWTNDYEDESEEETESLNELSSYEDESESTATSSTSEAVAEFTEEKAQEISKLVTTDFKKKIDGSWKGSLKPLGGWPGTMVQSFERKMTFAGDKLTIKDDNSDNPDYTINLDYSGTFKIKDNSVATALLDTIDFNKEDTNVVKDCLKIIDYNSYHEFLKQYSGARVYSEFDIIMETDLTYSGNVSDDTAQNTTLHDSEVRLKYENLQLKFENSQLPLTSQGVLDKVQ